MGKTLSSLIYSDPSDDDDDDGAVNCDENIDYGGSNNYPDDWSLHQHQKVTTLGRRNGGIRVLSVKNAIRQLKDKRKEKRNRNGVEGQKTLQTGKKSRTVFVFHTVQGFQLKLPKLVLTRCDDPIPRKRIVTNNTNHTTSPSRVKIEGLSSSPCPVARNDNDHSGMSQYVQIIIPSRGRGPTFRKGVYRCRLCQRVFPNIANSSRHVKTVHWKEKNFECPKCLKRFAHNQNLQNHLLAHGELKAFNCKLCDKAFKYGSNLSKHMALHKWDDKS